MESSGHREPLGALLIEQGLLERQELELALGEQASSGRKLGEILIDRGLLSRPLLARVLAEQAGVSLELENGFGSGLRALIEQRHLERAGVSADERQLFATVGSVTDRRSRDRRAVDRRKFPDRRRTEPSW